MTINPTNGWVSMPEIGVTFRPRLTRTEFLGLPGFANLTIAIKNEPWCSFHLPRFPLSATELLCTICYFRGEALEMLQMAQYPLPASARMDWTELQWETYYGQWLKEEMHVPPGAYPWGGIGASYDPKSDASSIGVRYKRPPWWKFWIPND